MQAVNTSKLIQALDRLKPELQPLPAHYAATHDAHTREIYATVLAAVLMAKGEVKESESRLFNMLLQSLGLGGQAAKFLNQASELDADGLRNFFRTITTDDLKSAFLVDTLILSRIDSPMGDSQCQLVSEIIDAFNSQNKVKLASLIASKVLGFPVDIKELGTLHSIKVTENYSEHKEYRKKVARLRYNVGSLIGKNENLIDMKYYGYYEGRVSNITGNYNGAQVPVEGILLNYAVSVDSEFKHGDVIAYIFNTPSYAAVWNEFLLA